MKAKDKKYWALISSDWNQCLAPSGPFDFVTFTYPFLEQKVDDIFKAYTSNVISLSEANRRILAILPNVITEDQMDVYLDECFETYSGVSQLIEWCSESGILFMINTTGVQGYFQRIFKKGLLPGVPVISASPMVKYDEERETACLWYDLLEIQDKSKNTLKVMHSHSLCLPSNKVIVMGDSGGDGPHFEWGAGVGAYLIGCMTKDSLNKYCNTHDIEISLRFGLSYTKGQIRDPEKEMRVNFMDLPPLLEAVLNL